VGAHRAPGYPGGALAPFGRSPDNVARYRPPGALARGHARLAVAALGEDLARSRALQLGQVVAGRAPALKLTFVPGRVFIEARS